MDDALSRTLENWQPFYAALLGTSGTLIGLLYVSVALRPALFTGKDHLELVTIALKTLGGLLNLLIFSFTFLAPQPRASILGWVLVGLGLASLWPTALQLRFESQTEMIRRRWGRMFLLNRIVLPGICYVGMVGVGVRLLLGEVNTLPGLAVISVVLLVMSLLNTWDLLVRPAQDSPANNAPDERAP